MPTVEIIKPFKAAEDGHTVVAYEPGVQEVSAWVEKVAMRNKWVRQARAKKPKAPPSSKKADSQTDSQTSTQAGGRTGAGDGATEQSSSSDQDQAQKPSLSIEAEGTLDL